LRFVGLFERPGDLWPGIAADLCAEQRATAPSDLLGCVPGAAGAAAFAENQRVAAELANPRAHQRLGVRPAR
jgi:hypothetical protein